MSTPDEPVDEARRGWDSDFVRFGSTPSDAIVAKLRAFLLGASLEQVRAWDDSIPRLQAGATQVREVREEAARYTAILEYELPLESRRADAIFLLRESVVVIELKGKSSPSDADIDQAHAYARDLRCYHAECEHRQVHALLVPTGARGDLGQRRGVRICGPDALDEVVREYDVRGLGEILDPRRFLSGDAYRPLPTLVAAARELFTHGTLRRIKRAAAATDHAIRAVSTIVHEAARTRTRHLVLLTGVPGAGKTLVGLRLVHSHPWQLRANAYRVLLTRARDATVVFVPPLPELNETFDYLVQAGFRTLESRNLADDSGVVRSAIERDWGR